MRDGLYCENCAATGGYCCVCGGTAFRVWNRDRSRNEMRFDTAVANIVRNRSIGPLFCLTEDQVIEKLLAGETVRTVRAAFHVPGVNGRG